MFPIREWFETEKSKKTGEWANQIIRFIRINWQPLVSQNEAELGMSYILGGQDMEFIRRLFQNTTLINLTNENKPASRTDMVNGFGQVINPSTSSDATLLKEMAALNFKPLPIMEKLRNVLIAEMKKMGAIVNVRSEDPTSTARKIQDKGLIEHKAEIESLLSYVYTSIGQQPYQLKDHKLRFGEKPGNGNVDQFEAMGLDAADPADVSFFMENFHKLDEEIAAEAPINYFMTYNQMLIEIEKLVTDILAKKACAFTCYVSDVTGAIMYRYLAPETVYIYGAGNRKDFNDANAKGYEVKRSIKEVLDIIGNKFDMEQQFNNLLLAITNTMNIEFTAIKPSYRGFLAGTEKLTNINGSTTYNFAQFMSFKVTLGYIEFTSQNQETFGEVKQDGGFYENNQSPDGKYPTQARWETPTYKVYYLAISQVDQVMFDFGELNYQDILGASDFNVNGTIITYKEIGDPIAIQAIQIIDMVNEAWYKFRYELRRAKPRGRGWNYDSMVSTLMDLIPDTNTSSFNKLQKVMEMLDSSANEIYTYPKGANGQQMPIPGNQLNYDIPNGMSKESMVWWEIMMNGIKYLSDMIGIAPLREGDPGNPRDSMNNQFKALEYSQSATYYIPDMLTNIFQQLAIKTNFYVQDIVTYKKYNTIAYKFLEDAIGTEVLNKIEKLDKTALHRFGIFVESLNQAPLRQKLEAVLLEAVKTKAITTAQYLLINDVKSVKKAFLTFAYFEQRNIKLAQKAEEDKQKALAAQEQAKDDRLMQLEKMKIDGQLQGIALQGKFDLQQHANTANAGITKKAMELEGDAKMIYDNLHAEMIKMMAEQGKIPPVIPPAPPAPPPAPNQPQMPSNSMNTGQQPTAPVSQQLSQRTMPMPTGAN